MRNAFRLSLALTALPLASAAVGQTAPTYAVSGSIAGPDGGWDYASVDPANHNVYVSHGDVVTIADPVAGTTRSIGVIAKAHASVPIPSLNVLLVTSGKDDSVRLFDPATGTEKAKIAVGTDPDAAFYDATGHRAVVMNAKAGTISVIDVAAAKVSRTITLKAGLEFGVLGPNAILFVNNEDANEIEIANLDTGKAGGAIALTGCTSPSGLAYDAKTGLLVSACANGKAAIVDAAKRKLVKLLDIGMGPDAVILNAQRRIAFIPCGKDGVLSEIALDAKGGPAVVGRITTEVGARTGAVDPATGAIYLPTAKFAAPVAPATRGAAVAGSFHILIVTPQIK
jgi:DNA-binding beta-propeller fold protein YncE